MLLGKTLIPEILETYAILPSLSALKQDTNICELVKEFETEFDLLYKFKKIQTSPEPLQSLREFVKEFTLIARTLDVPTILYFVDKVNNTLPLPISSAARIELKAAFYKANNISKPTSKPSQQNVPINEDDGFLNKLAEAMRECAAPCNYFEPLSDHVGKLADVGEAATSHTTALWDSAFELFQAPVFTTLNAFNKISTLVINEICKTFGAAESAFRNGLGPNFDQQRLQKERPLLQSGSQTLESTSESYPFTNSISRYFSVGRSSSDIMNNAANNLKDCFRIADYYKRFNYQDPDMNFGKARRVVFNINVNGYSIPHDAFGKEIVPYRIPQSVSDLSNSSILPQAKKYDDIGQSNMNSRSANSSSPQATSIDDKVPPEQNTQPASQAPANETVNGITTQGQYNPTSASVFEGNGVEPLTQATYGPNGELYASGKESNFGGISDPMNQGDLSITSSTGLTNRDLNVADDYFAYRADYSKTSLHELRNSYFEFYNPQNGATVLVPPPSVSGKPGTGFVDWGPHIRTGRSIDLSPGLEKKLGSKTDDTIFWRRVPAP
jgi:hypothetical protein